MKKQTVCYASLAQVKNKQVNVRQRSLAAKKCQRNYRFHLTIALR